MKKLKAGKCIKCIKSYEFGGGGAVDSINFNKIEAGKWYKIKSFGFGAGFNNFIIYDANDNTRNVGFIADYFDLGNPLDYNPSELEEARLKRKSAYEASTQKEDKPKFKVGNRVRILKDAVVDTHIGTVLITEFNGVLSAVGKIGVISNIVSCGQVYVSDLPSECMLNWTWGVRYSMDSIELVTDDEPKFKVGDVVAIKEWDGYINLRGIVCKISRQEAEISFIPLGHINPILGWFKLKNLEPADKFKKVKRIVEEYEPITPENIAKVLRYNAIEGWTVDKIGVWYDSIDKYFSFKIPKWLQHLEVEVGKLKPLPKKKEPTLEEALIELGFAKIQDNQNLGFNRYLKGSLIILPTDLPTEHIISNYHTFKEGVITYTTKEQLAKDIAAFEEKYNQPTFEEALSQLGFNKEDGECCHTKGRLAVCTGRFQEIYIRKRITETQEPITYTTKEQLIKDIAEFEKKNRAHWSLVDDGGHGKEIKKLYRDEILLNDTQYCISGALMWLKSWNNYKPYIYVGQERDFGILCEDGSLIKAFWRGEE